MNPTQAIDEIRELIRRHNAKETGWEHSSFALGGIINIIETTDPEPNDKFLEIRQVLKKLIDCNTSYINERKPGWEQLNFTIGELIGILDLTYPETKKEK